MNILVTGGCGFIGSNFIKHMLDTYDYKITNIDKLTYAGSRKNLKDYDIHSNYYFVKGDINERELLEHLIESRNIDTIINFAAESHVDNSIENSDEFIHTNINGTHTLLKMLHKFPIKKFIQISTDEVYGTLGEYENPFTEDTPLAPNSPYAASKTAADLLCRSFHETYGYPITITRCSNNYGPNQYPEKLIMIKNVTEGKKLPVYGDGRNIRDWIHVTDHCRAIDKVLHYGKDGEVYNIGGECELRNIEIVNTILRGLNKSQDLIEFVEDRLGHDWRYAMDIDKISYELDWEPQIDFEDGIKELLDEV
jgi:dTDP-glucose 4,6-dehydratase